MQPEDKTPKNEKGLNHGHWLLHWWNSSQVMFDLYYINGVNLGLFMEYKYDGIIRNQHYYAR